MMKKKFLLIGALVCMLAACCAFAFIGCDDNEREDPEGITYSEATNPYAEKTWEEYGDLFDWGAKWDSDPVVYVFEGSYSEAYQGNYSRTYLYMNCYEDGSLHAQYGWENYYGYWTNVDNYGREQLVLHLVRYNDGEYNNGVYESVVSPYDSAYYEYSSSVIWNQWGTRTVLIFGFRYSPVTAVTLDTSKVKTEYMLGESLNTAGLGVTVTRENGASALVEEVSGQYTHVNYEGFDSNKAGTQTVTVSYDREKSATATYDVNVIGVESVDIDVSAAKTEYSVGDGFDASGITVVETYENGVTKTVPGDQLTVEGFDTSAAAENQEVTVSWRGESASFTVNVTAPVFKGNTTYNGSSTSMTVTILTPDTCSVQFSGKTVTAAYDIREIAGKTIYFLSAPEDGIVGSSEEEWAGLTKTFTADKAAGTLAGIAAYVVPNDDGLTDLGAGRDTYEVMPGISGGTTNRYVLIDEAAGECTVTYKYYNDTCIDTFVAKYTLSGNTLTLTDVVSQQVSASGKSFADLVKTYTLNEDGTVFTVK